MIIKCAISLWNVLNEWLQSQWIPSRAVSPLHRRSAELSDCVEANQLGFHFVVLNIINWNILLVISRFDRFLIGDCVQSVGRLWRGLLWGGRFDVQILCRRQWEIGYSSRYPSRMEELLSERCYTDHRTSANKRLVHFNYLFMHRHSSLSSLISVYAFAAPKKLSKLPGPLLESVAQVYSHLDPQQISKQWPEGDDLCAILNHLCELILVTSLPVQLAAYTLAVRYCNEYRYSNTLIYNTTVFM